MALNVVAAAVVKISMPGGWPGKNVPPGGRSMKHGNEDQQTMAEAVLGLPGENARARCEAALQARIADLPPDGLGKARFLA